MLNWRKIPFIRLLLPFLLGLSLALAFDISFPFLPILLAILFGGILLFAFSSIDFKYRWVFGITLHLFFVAFGYLLGVSHHELRQENHFQKYLEKENWILAQVNDFPKAGERISVSGKILGIASRDSKSPEWKNCEGNTLLYLESHPDYADLRYGDQLLIAAKINLLNGPNNPKAFDFRNYQHFKNTHYQLFAKKDQWKIVDREQGNPFLAKAFAIRTHFLKTLRKHLPTDEEYGVAGALILGNRSALTAEVKTAYSSTGATHVLAVSGLHVGFIYLGLAFFLSLFKIRSKYWSYFSTLILILSVWAFAFVTGASPSVLRAATMFSFIILGSTLNRDTNIYNTLALSAFFLLCINPYLIAEAGFQLSYLAVLGIVSFQAWIYRLWIVDNPVGDYIWKLVSVSLAAQITTFPITLFYFHQFPFYFWLSGLVVVPAAMLILGGGLLLFFLESTIPFLAGLVGAALYGIIWLMNAVVYLIQQLPVALIQGLWIGLGGMMLLYLSLLLLTYIFWRGKRFRVFAAAFCLTLLMSASAWQSYERQNQREIVVYNVSRNSLVDLVDGRSRVSFQSEGLEEKSINFAAQNYRWKQGIQKKEEYYFDHPKEVRSNWYFQNGFLQYYHQRLAFLDQQKMAIEHPPMELDYLLLRNSPKIDFEKLQQRYPSATWMADASNAPWTVSGWQQKCESLNIPFINLVEKGAQIISLKK